MHFSKVLSVTLFAALATASPVPADISISQGQLETVAQNLDNFAQSTDNSASDVTQQLQTLAASSGGQLAQNIPQWTNRLSEVTKELVGVAQEISTTLKDSGKSYEQTESESADNFGELLNRLSGDEASKQTGSDDEAAKTSTGADDADNVKEAGTASNSLGAGGPSQ
ncbi:WXG100 family type VII secretion target [Aspergillus puulaauensis]|uniref:Hydrophobic surface binding protein A-domain-containing protein n=1 Tax=Aspergillus puulaauensis TaxID=1220207 RepID=A0A7R8ALG8_9EURO|nr:uncharacterized protein APUU_22087S [Aspergillus puulaauensis]BCS21655.1 hypothetical protein APUU_22087S [Aspergillus puulaauensis]